MTWTRLLLQVNLEKEEEEEEEEVEVVMVGSTTGDGDPSVTTTKLDNTHLLHEMVTQSLYLISEGVSELLRLSGVVTDLMAVYIKIKKGKM